MSRVFSLLHQARNGPRIKTDLVKDSDGNVITTEANCLERWKEHFGLLLRHNTTSADPTVLAAANVTTDSTILATANVMTPSNACKTAPVTTIEVRAAWHLCNNRRDAKIGYGQHCRVADPHFQPGCGSQRGSPVTGPGESSCPSGNVRVTG